MSKLFNLAKENTNTTGSGTMTLTGASTGYLTFEESGVLNEDVVSYGVEDGNEREVGRGVYTTSGSTLTRSVLNSTNSGSPIDLSGNANVFITALAEDVSQSYVMDGRLTLESGVPVSTTDQSAKTTLYLTPYKGDKIALYDGVGVWNVLTFAELSLDISGYTASKPYDIWVYNNAGAAALDSTIWTDGTTRATALTTQNGVLVKTGATTRRYIGTIYINSSGSQSDDALAKRFVWNYYNQEQRQVQIYQSTASWTYGTDTWRSLNNSTANRVQIVVGLPTTVDLRCATLVVYSAAAIAHVGIGEDKTNGSDCTIPSRFKLTTASMQVDLVALLCKKAASGFHYYQSVERSDGNAEYYAGGVEAVYLAGINGWLMG